MIQRILYVVFASIALAACANANDTAASLSAHVADLPHWMGGLPDGVPPRRGTPEYDAWEAQRAQEAARPKTGSAPNHADTRDLN